jgi:uncharacterized protein YybS (DUF2232 family)
MSMYALLGIYSLPYILFFFPTPFIYLGIRRGSVVGILGITAVSVLVGIIADIYSGILLFELFMPITLVIITQLKNRKRPMEILLYSATVFFISALLLYGLFQDVTGVSFIAQMEQIFNESINYYIEILKETGRTNYELLQQREFLETGFKSILTLFPVILLAVSMFIGYSNHYLSVLVLRKAGIGIVSIPKFSNFKLPNNIIPGTIIMFLGVYLTKNFNVPYYNAIVMNLIFFMWLLFSIQGLSILDYYMMKLKFRSFLRIIILIFITFIVPLGTVIALVGVSDVIFDFRKLKRRES